MIRLIESGELQCVFADAWDRVVEGDSEIIGLELPESVEGPEGMETVEGWERTGLVGGEDLAEGRGDFDGVTFEQEALSGEAPPGIAMAQKRDQQLVLSQIEGDGWGGAIRVAGSDPPDASAVGSGADVLLFADPFRDVVGVFDDLPMHVEEVEGAVGAHFKADGAEVGIAAGDEFAMGFLRGATGDEDGADGLDDFAMNEIADDIADENGALEIGGPRGAGEESHSACGGEVAGLFRMIGACDGIRDGKDPGHLTVVGDAAGGVEGG